MNETSEHTSTTSGKIYTYIVAVTALIVAITGFLSVIQPRGPGILGGQEDIDELSKTMKAQEAYIKPDEALKWASLHSDGSYFAKDGYYLAIDNNLKLFPSTIDKQSAQVRIVTETGVAIVNQRLITGSGSENTVSFKYKDIPYRVTLVKTGKAGRNPFTKAAFFDVDRSLTISKLSPEAVAKNPEKFTNQVVAWLAKIVEHQSQNSPNSVNVTSGDTSIKLIIADVATLKKVQALSTDSEIYFSGKISGVSGSRLLGRLSISVDNILITSTP